MNIMKHKYILFQKATIIDCFEKVVFEWHPQLPLFKTSVIYIIVNTLQFLCHNTITQKKDQSEDLKSVEVINSYCWKMAYFSPSRFVKKEILTARLQY